MFSFFKKKDNGNVIGSPCKGTLISMKDVNDPTFSEEMLGPGAAVIPAEGCIVAPADGEISLVFDTLHAISLTTVEGAELLIHVGLDTVKRNGEGFTCHVSTGQAVKKGDLLLEVDLDAIKADGYDTVIPMIICNADEFSKVQSFASKEVAALEPVIEIHK